MRQLTPLHPKALTSVTEMYELLCGRNLISPIDDLDEEDSEYKEAKRIQARQEKDERKMREAARKLREAEKKAREKAEGGGKSKKKKRASKKAPELIDVDLEDSQLRLHADQMDVDSGLPPINDGLTTDGSTSDGDTLMHGFSTDGTSEGLTDYDADKSMSMASSPNPTRGNKAARYL